VPELVPRSECTGQGVKQISNFRPGGYAMNSLAGAVEQTDLRLSPVERSCFSLRGQYFGVRNLCVCYPFYAILYFVIC
jgi:hypothetical protein